MTVSGHDITLRYNAIFLVSVIVSKVLKGKTVNFRIDRDLEPAVAAWLSKHRDFDTTTLCNMALRSFITTPHVLEPVDVGMATDDEVMKAVRDVERDHADALKKLK